MWGQNSDVLTSNDFDPAPPCRPCPAPPDFFWTDRFGLILLILAETRFFLSRHSFLRFFFMIDGINSTCPTNILFSSVELRTTK